MIEVLNWVVVFFAILGFSFTTLFTFLFIKEWLEERKLPKFEDLEALYKSPTVLEFEKLIKSEINMREQKLKSEGFPHCCFKKGISESDFDDLEFIAYWCGQNDIKYQKKFLHQSDYVIVDSLLDKDNVVTLGDDREFRIEYGYVYGFKNKADLAHFILKWMEKENYET